MMEEKTIDSLGYKYIGEFMNDLPENVMLNKVTTGCGMTSVVLENDVKYVLVVPYVSLIKNKKQWCKERGIKVCDVYHGGANEKDVKAYKGEKIITTYDSLGKVTDLLEERGDLKDWKICIDEAHKLVDSAAFRPKAIKNVLDNYSRYKSFVFGTATPIDDKYQLPALKHIQKVRILWNNLEMVKVNYCHYESKINDVAATLAIEFLKGERQGNAHIFINSVSSICSIIKKIKRGGYDMPNDIRIVCSDNPRNQNLIDKRLPGTYFIFPVNSNVKKINFYTATAFEGCDIYDEHGRNFIVTDGSKDHTKIDIVTVLPQIIGRIRNSMYNSTVDLLYTKNQYLNDMTEKEFREQVLKNIAVAKKDVMAFNNLSPESKMREVMVKNNDSPYFIVDGDELLVNEASQYNEMNNFSTIRQTYFVSSNGVKSGIVNATKNFNGVDYQYKSLERIEIKGLNKVRLGRTACFKDLCIDYLKLIGEEPSLLRTAKLLEIKNVEPLISEAYKILGEQKMKALKYRRPGFKAELLVRSNEVSKDFKIVVLLGLRIGEWISRSEAKLHIQEAYRKLGLNKSAKATDLEKWFYHMPKRRREKGKLISGFVLTGCKINLNQ